MTEQGNTGSEPETPKPDSGTDLSNLQRDLDWLATHISKQEQKLEDLQQDIFSETNLTRKLTLQNKMKFHKKIIETARHDWEQAYAAFTDKTAERKGKAMRYVRKAYDGLLEISE